MNYSRNLEIEKNAGNGNLEELKKIISEDISQYEIDIALENTVAYSQIETAKYLLSLGASFSTHDYQGLYYAVHNNEIEGLKFAVKNGVDININNGMIINTSILTCINVKNNGILKWIIKNGGNISLLTTENINLALKYGNEELKTLINCE